MRSTKSPRLKSFSERTTSVYRNVKFKDRDSFFLFFWRRPFAKSSWHKTRAFSPHVFQSTNSLVLFMKKFIDSYYILYLITICHRYQTTNLKNKNICFTFRLSKGHISLLPKSFELKPCCNVNSEGLVARHFIESALSIAKVTPGCINKRTSTCLAWTMIVYF